MSLFRIRKALALAALATLGLLIVTADWRLPDGSLQRSAVAFWVLLVPLVGTMVAFAGERTWSRWPVLAVAIAVLPWSVALLLGPTYGAPTFRAQLALLAAVVLFLSTSGKGMAQHYEGKTKGGAWGGARMSLVSWTIAANLASILTLYVFVAGYRASVPWVIGIPAALLLGLLIGVLLLAYQKTAGLLLVGVCCILFLPTGGYFVWREAQYPGEALLFAAAFAPGVVTGWACLLVFGRPMWRRLTSG
jgi:hypothetical protein